MCFLRQARRNVNILILHFMYQQEQNTWDFSSKPEPDEFNI